MHVSTLTADAKAQSCRVTSLKVLPDIFNFPNSNTIALDLANIS